MIRFGDPLNKRHPAIIHNRSKVTGQTRKRARSIIYPSGLWSQTLSSSKLNPFASCFRPDPDASTLTVWSGFAGALVFEFPVLLDKDARPVLCFVSRKLDNSNWDKVRIIIPTSVSTELVFECDWTDPDTPFGAFGFVPGFYSINGDASIAFLSEANSLMSWRKRDGVVEKITFVGKMTNHGPYLANMSDNSVLVFPNYSKSYSGAIKFHVDTEIPTGSPTSVTRIENAGTNQIQMYDLKPESPSLVPVNFDPLQLMLDFEFPTILSFIGKLPFDESGYLRVWASGRESFNPNSTGFERSACIGFRVSSGVPDGGDLRFTNASFSWGKRLRGSIAKIDSNGNKIWQHDIDVFPDSPIENDDLINPFDSAFATQVTDNVYTDQNNAAAAEYPLLSWRPYDAINYGGRCPPLRLQSASQFFPGHHSGGSMAFTKGGFGVTGEFTPGDPYARVGYFYSSGEFNIPNYNHFKDVGIELLPRGRNLTLSTKPSDDLTKNLNWNVFEDWTAQTAQVNGTITIKKSDQATYAAYIVPRQCYFGGMSTLAGSITPLKNMAPDAYPEIIFDRDSRTFSITPSTGPDFLMVIDPQTYPDWVNGSGATYYGVGMADSFYSGPIGTVNTFFVRSQSYLAMRYVRKIDTNGVLVWSKDMTQLIAGAEFWKKSSDMDLRPFSKDYIGAVSTELLPLGDDMGPLRPTGRVVFQWVDFHELGPNFLPTQKLVIYNDDNGDVLHTLDLSNLDGGEDPAEVLATEMREPDIPGPPEGLDSTSFTGDGTTTKFSLTSFAVKIDLVTISTGDIPYSLAPDGLSIIFESAPPSGANISVFWFTHYGPGTPGALIWRRGEKRFDPVVTEIHVGIDPNSREWALVSITQTDRLNGSHSGGKLLRLKMGANITVVPDIQWAGSPIPPEQAIEGGSLYKIAYTGPQTRVLQKTNPSTV